MRLVIPAVALMVLLPVAVPAAEPQTLTYEIRKEGEPIGREVVRFAGTVEAPEVEVETHTKAKVLFLEFHYDHLRHESWRDGKLVRMVADTDDDGSVSHLDAAAEAAGWTVKVAGKTSQRPAASLPLTLWGKAVLGRTDLFSVIDAKPYRVQVVSLGVENVSVGGAQVAAEHVRITGEVERDLWYGDDGYLLRATFQRAGYPIEMVKVGS